MARADGRVSWIAWPATLLSVGIVGALVWLAVPGLPGAVDFVGSTLRGAAVPGAAAADADAEPATDCRTLYPDRLWGELTWTPKVLLSQNSAAPSTATALATALGPSVRFSCVWRTEDGRAIQSTVSTVAAGSAPVAQAALSADGFSCAADGERVHCERVRGDVTELHDLAGDVWLASALTGWLPDDYGALTASRVFPG